MNKPKFDPSQPFEAVNSKPKFDPTKPFEAAPSSAADKPTDLNTIQEMPDYISLKDRFVAKNFASTPEKQLEYLKQQHPDKEWALANGEVVTRAKGDPNWKVLDPNNVMNPISSDLGYDLLDLPMDTLSGAVQKTATTAGFLGGAMVPLPGTAMVGASGASALAGGGMEAVKQGIGQIAGIPDNMNANVIKNQAAFGAVNPLLFGVDKVPTEALSAARGIPKRIMDKVGPEAVQFMTGIEPEIQQNYLKQKAFLQNIAANNGQFGMLQGIRDKANSTMDNYLSNLGQKIGGMMGDKKVNPQAAMSPLKNEIARIESDPEANKFNGQTLGVLKNRFDQLFQLNKPRVPDLNTIPEAQPILSDIEKAAALKAEQTPANLTSTIENNLPAKQSAFPVYEPGQESFLSDVNKFARGNVDQDLAAIQKSSNELALAASQKASAERDAYLKQKLAELEALKNKYTQTHYNDEISMKKLFEIQQQSKLMDRRLTDPMANLTEAERAVSKPISNTYHSINGILNDATGGASQEAKDAYGNFVHIKDRVQPGFKTDQATYNTIVDTGKKGKTELAAQLQNLSDNGVMDLSKDFDNLRTLNAYHGMGDNNYIMQSAPKGGKGFQALMGAGGFAAGYRMNPWAAAPLGATAGYVAKKLGSQPAARFYNAVGGNVDNIANFMANWGLSPTGAMTGKMLPSPWAVDPQQPQP
jgi:hypothetical protein